MRSVVKFRWLFLAAWAAALAVLLATAPSLQQLVREKGDIRLPEGYPSDVADRLLDEMKASGERGGELSAVLVFHRGEGLTPADLEEVKRGISALEADREAGVTSVLTHFDRPEMADLMVSKDGRTVLALVRVDPGDRELKDVRDSLYAALDGIGVAHYLTGSWLINLDVVLSAEAGLKRTEGITVVFILVILLAVFRAAAAPLVPLITVGVTYLVSQAVVAFLAKYADFPLSTFTQIFLVAVLFGIGTDYCILLISRFREELARLGDKKEAVVETYRTAGRTVFVSGLAVLVGFASIGLSTFGLYRSAVAVAVGIAVLLLAIFTLVPLFLATLGKAVFWPSHRSGQHRESRLWEAVGRFSLRRPLASLLLVALATAPFLASYRGAPSYNSLEEIGDSYDSVKAFNIIAESFGPGDSLPSTVVVKADKPMNTKEGLAFLERAARELSAVDGVKTVRGATRPTGEELADFRVTRQVETLGEGLGQGEDGIGRIAEGLAEAERSLGKGAPQLSEAADGARQLAKGAAELEAGIARVGDALHRIEQGLRDGSAGAAELRDGLAQAHRSAGKLADAGEELAGHYRRLEDGLGQLSAAYRDIGTRLGELAQGLNDLGQGLEGLALKYPALREDPDFLRAKGAVAGLQEGASGLEAGLKELQTRLDGVVAGLAQANAGLEQAVAGQKELVAGLRQLEAGLAELQAGIARAADGQSQVTAGLPEMAAGARQLGAGQRELAEGIAKLKGQLGELTAGLRQSVDGLTKVQDGLAAARGYLDELAAAPDKELSGWFAPEEALADESFRQALETYMSRDGTIVSFDVVFAANPYDTETLDKVDDLKAAVERAAKGTAFEDAEIAVGGVTSTYNDLRTVSSADFTRTATIMLIGIGLILLLLFRSVVIPVYLLVSLLIAYFASVGFAEALFVRLMGMEGLSWAVPFFAFVMLIALGVDYSIFLMDRFREYRHLPPHEAIVQAMRNTGMVILSAAIILGGTFAAMIPSGVLSLLQIAAIMLFGLMLYALVMLPLFVPVMVRLFGNANWWPFAPGGAVSAAADGNAADGKVQMSRG